MNKLIFLFFCSVIFNSIAQDKIPHIQGKVDISIKNGTFDCNLTINNIPDIKDYYIRLNSGMNLLHIKSKKPQEFLLDYSKSFTDTTSTGESLAYYFLDDTGDKQSLPDEIQFKYVGKYPVISDTLDDYSISDWKGNIAFNQITLRTDGLQSAWYPVFYDVEKDQVFEKVTYDIVLNCEDCNVLYINGNLPQKSNQFSFQSVKPQEMALFCGNYDFVNKGNTYILNSKINDEQLTEFTSLINSYQQFYEKKLKIPYDQAPVFISTTPTSKDDAWLFVSYPSIYSIGWNGNGLESLFNPATQNWFRPFIAHELAHYYFGTFKVFNSILGDMFSEGFAEYLSFQLTKNLIGKDVLATKINTMIENTKAYNPTVVPFSKVKSLEDYGERDFYVYYFAPLVFYAIEKEIGDEKMWQWIKNILTTKTQSTNYEFLCTTLKNTLKNDNKYNEIKQKYFENDNVLLEILK